MTTTKRTSGNRGLKNKMAQGFDKVMNNVDDMVDTISHRLWEITR